MNYKEETERCIAALDMLMARFGNDFGPRGNGIAMAKIHLLRLQARVDCLESVQAVVKVTTSLLTERANSPRTYTTPAAITTNMGEQK